MAQCIESSLGLRRRIRFAGNTKLPTSRRRAAHRMPKPSCTSSLTRVQRGAGERTRFAKLGHAASVLWPRPRSGTTPMCLRTWVALKNWASSSVPTKTPSSFPTSRSRFGFHWPRSPEECLSRLREESVARIDGIDVTTAMTVFSELGKEMSRGVRRRGGSNPCPLDRARCAGHGPCSKLDRRSESGTGADAYSDAGRCRTAANRLGPLPPAGVLPCRSSRLAAEARVKAPGRREAAL